MVCCVNNTRNALFNSLLLKRSKMLYAFFIIVVRQGIYFFKYVLLIVLLQTSHICLSFIPPPPCTCPPCSIPLPLSSCQSVIHMFFGFSVSNTILNLSPSILCLPITFLTPCTFPSPPPATENPPCDLHCCDTVPVLVVCLVFVFVF